MQSQLNAQSNHPHKQFLSQKELEEQKIASFNNQQEVTKGQLRKLIAQQSHHKRRKQIWNTLWNS